jgi:hypothetical protein
VRGGLHDPLTWSMQSALVPSRLLRDLTPTSRDGASYLRNSALPTANVPVLLQVSAECSAGSARSTDIRLSAV